MNFETLLRVCFIIQFIYMSIYIFDNPYGLSFYTRFRINWRHQQSLCPQCSTPCKVVLTQYMKSGQSFFKLHILIVHIHQRRLCVDMSVDIILREYIVTCINQEFPPNQLGRKRRLVVSDAIEAIFKLLRTGMQWREVVCKCGASFSTVHRHFQLWCRAGIFTRAYTHVLQVYKNDIVTSGVKYYCVDSTYVKNLYGIEGVGRNPTDRGRKALKISTIVDDMGVVCGVHASPGNVPDVVLFSDTIRSALQPPLDTNVPLLADKGYDSRANRVVCERHMLFDRIARRKAKVGRRMNGKRSIVERAFSWIDKYRRLLVNYEKYVDTHVALTYLCLSHLYTRRFSLVL